MNIFKKRLEACDFSIIIYSRYKSSCPEVFSKKGILRDFAKFTGNTCAGVSFLIKLQPEVRNFIQKEAVAQVFSCEFYAGWCSAGPVLPHWEKVRL